MVETGDNTPHPIEDVNEVPVSHVEQKGKLMNGLHVSTIMKKLVSTSGCKFNSRISGASARKRQTKNCKQSSRKYANERYISKHTQ